MIGKNISLRTILAKDSAHYFRWINDKPLVLYNADFKPISKEEHEQWFANVNTNPTCKSFSIVENSAQKLIGSCSLRNINPASKNAELQIRIGERNFHGKGLGTEAVSLLVDYGFVDLNLKRIYLHVFSSNTRAIKAYEKCFFNLEGTMRDAALIDGRFVDVCVMARLNDNYFSEN